MKKSRFITGFGKVWFYWCMALRCAWRFRSLKVLWKAGKFTGIFFKHKLLRLPSGEYKLDFYMPRYPSEAFFTAMSDKLLRMPPRPVSVVWSITRACAYRCPHCYQGLDPVEETPLEAMRVQVRELIADGVVAWAVEGGEPLLKFDRLEALLEETRGLEVWVNSTGFGADNHKLLRLKELGVTGVMSSIHSVDRKRHDEFTGYSGSFDLALSFLRHCRELDILTGFNTVLTDEEILSGGIDRIMRLAEENCCDYVQLIHPKSCGRWLDVSFDAGRHADAVEAACRAQRYYNSFSGRRYPVLTAQVYEESEFMLGCTAGGVDRFYVGCSGEVQPCEFVNISFGNLNNESYKEIMGRMRSAFPVPSCEWLCCKRAEEIAGAIHVCGGKTPLPWDKTSELIRNWRPGKPTPVYKKLGIYR